MMESGDSENMSATAVTKLSSGNNKDSTDQMAAIKQSSNYLWIPGTGPDASALDRMTRAFPRPGQPMGEAWFMGSERKMFAQPLSTPVPELEIDYVQLMLREILMGPPCFGQREEWTEWFHYLLPRLIPLALQNYGFSVTQESLVCAMFAQHPDPDFVAPYADFRENMLATLGRTLMSADVWEGGRMKPGTVLLHEGRHYGVPWWYRNVASPSISATLFLCLKYLHPDQIGGWVESVFRIDCPYWRGQLMIWLLGAKPFFEGKISQPKQFEDLEPEITWEYSHCLSGEFPPDMELVLPPGFDDSTRQTRNYMTPFVSDANRAAFNDACHRALPDATREDWCAQVAAVPLLEREMGDYIRQFAEMQS